MGYVYEFLDGIDGTKHIAHVRDGDEASALVEESPVCLYVQSSIVSDGDYPYFDTHASLYQLPRNDIGMVLHVANDDLVALLHESLREARSHQIDTLRGATCEDYLAGLFGTDEFSHRLSASFVQVGGRLRKEVYATMHIGIDIVILVAHGLHHASGFLRSSTIVQIHERVLLVYGFL